MKHLFTLILGLLVTVGYAQKKELRQAQKLFKASKIEEAKSSLSTNQAIIEGSEDARIKTQYHFLKGQIARLDKDFQASIDNLKLAEGNSALKAALASEIQQLTSDIVNAAIAQSEAKEFIPSSENLYLAYQELFFEEKNHPVLLKFQSSTTNLYFEAFHFQVYQKYLILQ